MVVIGNPPYAVSSSNKSEWIQTLIADYKKNLNEKKINLDDDYIKFIRMGQHREEWPRVHPRLHLRQLLHRRHHPPPNAPIPNGSL